MIKLKGRVVISENYPDDSIWILDEDGVEIDMEETLGMFGKDTIVNITIDKTCTNDVGDLWMTIGDGNAIVRSDNNEIEFADCTPISIEDLKYIIREAESFIKYRDKRRLENAIV